MRNIKLFHILLAMAVLVSSGACSEDVIDIDDDDITPVTGDGYPFTVVGRTEEPVVKTSLSGSDTDGYSVLWSENDSFKQLYTTSSNACKSRSFTLVSGAGKSSATFGTGTELGSGDLPFISVYPSGIVKGWSEYDGPVSIEWPASQPYCSGSITDVPMYSETMDTDGPYEFKNLGGILRLKIKGSGTVTGVTISSDKAMAGDAIINAQSTMGHTSYVVKVLSDTGSKEIEMSCGQDGVELSDQATEFWFSVPAGTYTGLKVIVHFNISGLEGYCVKQCKESVVVERSMITDASFSVSPDGAFAGTDRQYSVTSASIRAGVIEKMLSMSGIGSNMASLVENLLGGVLDNAIPSGKNFYLKRVFYLTPSPAGGYVKASGVMAFPEDVMMSRTYDRIVSVQHGTCDIDNAPSSQEFSIELCPVLVKTESGGEFVCKNVVALADYIGYGSSQTTDLQQTYMHMKYTGEACADMLKATDSYLAYNGYRYSDSASTTRPISLCGYSQGGEATIATLYSLEEKGLAGRVDDVKAGAGPHDLIEMMNFFKSRVTSETEYIPYAQAGYIPYMIRGILYGDQALQSVRDIRLDEVYGDSALQNQEIFNTTMLSTWHSVLGTNVADVLHSDFFKDSPSAMNASAQVLYSRALANSNTSCCPQNCDIITLYHCPADDQVPYACSTNAHDKWSGSTLVDLSGVTDAGIQKNTHAISAVEFYLRYLGAWNQTAQSALTIIGLFL